MYLCLFDAILLCRGFVDFEYINLSKKQLGWRVVFMWDLEYRNTPGQRWRTGSRKLPGKGVAPTSWAIVVAQTGHERCKWLRIRVGREE